jgi:protein MpaA
LYGLDVKRAKDPRFARKLRDELKLPHRKLTCRGGCHGTLSQWFNKEHDGACVTVEWGYNPSMARLTKQAPKGFLRVFGASYVG